MDKISLQGIDLNINGYKINLLDIDFIIFDNGINIYKSNGRIINFKIDLNNFIEIGKALNNAGIEQFVYLKGNRIVNAENIKKVLYGKDYIEVLTENHKVKMNGLAENEARLLAGMYFNSTFISDYNLTR